MSMDGYVHDSKRTVEIDPRNDPAIFSVKGDDGGVSQPNKIKGGATGTSESLTLLGAGRPYGQC